MERTGIGGLGFLHFSQLYPLGGDVIKYLERAEKVIGIENNLTGQFADLIARETGFMIGRRITKYNGLPFSVEEMKELLLKEIK
jgi:2-oxoglutarate ferredoxin oxidoreductase subunit alpha